MKLSPVDPIASLGRNDGIVIGACCVSLAALLPVALYQTGVLARLPDPPFRVFNSERITSSKSAHPLGIPDALLGIASFGTTLALTLLARRHRMTRKMLGAKLTLDLAASAFNTGRQVASFGQLCSWCTVTALAGGTMAFAGRDIIRSSWADAASALEGVIVRPEKTDASNGLP